MVVARNWIHEIKYDFYNAVGSLKDCFTASFVRSSSDCTLRLRYTFQCPCYARQHGRLWYSESGVSTAVTVVRQPSANLKSTASVKFSIVIIKYSHVGKTWRARRAFQERYFFRVKIAVIKNLFVRSKSLLCLMYCCTFARP